MLSIDYVAQAAKTTALGTIRRLADVPDVQSIDAAVAYVTSGGVADFIEALASTLGARWPAVRKRWLTSFDYYRTEPIAVAKLAAVPKSSVRIFEGVRCLQNDCAPRVPFHPKLFLVDCASRISVLAGSGNLSRSGLSRGIEAGLALTLDKTGTGDPSARAAIRDLNRWFRTTWSNADRLSPGLLDQYRDRFESVENLRAPAVTEDDVASGDTGRDALSARALQKLRVCRHFWIAAGNVTRNRGPHLPGNQLMMKRLSRVYFGYPPTYLAQNSHIGDVRIRFGPHAPQFYSLTFSDNKMDKLVLPIPDAGGPPEYDNKYLLFSRGPADDYVLRLGSVSDVQEWRRRSEAIDGRFRMSSGREWGVF